jgi:NAD(P)-dependent dehydrogenase (short-subunit alcohol dehydrogenase family)
MTGGGPGQYRPPDFTGAVAVVTGGGQGIGAAIARALAAGGARVVISGRHPGSLTAVAEQITSAGGECGWVAGRVIHALVNNAGIAGPSVPLAQLSLADWDEVIAVNLTGVFLACQAAIPYLQAAPHGKIVNIGSATGKRPLPNRTPYAAAKLGVVGLTRTLAHELGPDNISVNTVSPFLVDNARLGNVVAAMAAATGRAPTELRDELTAGTAFGRPVTEDDVTRLVLMLCSSAADDLTGQDLNVTAGAVMY